MWFGLVTAAGGMASFWISALLHASSQLAIWGLLALPPMVFMAFLAAEHPVRARRWRVVVEHARDSGDHPEARRAFQYAFALRESGLLLTRAGRLLWRPSADRLNAALAARSLERPRAIVQREAMERVRFVALVEALLEPEPIGTRPSAALVRRGWWWSTALFAVFLIGVVWTNRTGANFYRPIVPVFGVLALTPGVIATLQRSGMIGRPVQRRAMAVPGGVKDARGRRWTVHDSVMLVRRVRAVAEPVSPIEPVRVTLLGPAGALHLRFADPVEDEGFVGLWQRWMHPHPRVELLDSA